MTPKQQAAQLRRLDEARAKMARRHMYTWDDARGRFVILAPANHGGGILATLEATDVDTAARQAHAICAALDRMLP